MNGSKKRVIVGLSGGVDSSVAAHLLIQQGFQVEGLFMKNWEQDDNDHYCASSDDLRDAKGVADLLNIPLHTVNFADEYWDNVFAHCLKEFKLGRTPNPDVLCNREIKFNTFLDYACQLGANYMATGHYAQNSQEDNQQYCLKKGLDPNKDQSYFLYHLNQSILPKVLFPIGDLDKINVRQIAKDLGLPTAEKKDSTGICFIGKRKFKTFLEKFIPAQPGPIETPDKKVLGQHSGLMFYTLGQRQGLNIGGQKASEGLPWYVVAKDIARNALVIAEGDNHPLLFKNTLQAEGVHWITPTLTNIATTASLSCHAKIRYRQIDQACQLDYLGEDRYQVTFEHLQRAITPGQSIVFYQEDICLGGGIIQ
jgi:tRNA-specific 2-thiouridylase